jgi:predicted RNase H-related nuclease YkuK (DUF458 family)
MQRFEEGYFYNPTKGNLTLDGTLEEMMNYMLEKPDIHYEIVVGCDSSSEEEPHFPVAIVILRKGAGGRFFLKKITYHEEKKFYNFRQRILEEVLLSCELALVLKEALEKKKMVWPKILKWEFIYVHADVGERGATREMIKQVTGLIRGSGFEPVIKPYSFAASAISDRYT